MGTFNREMRNIKFTVEFKKKIQEWTQTIVCVDYAKSSKHWFSLNILDSLNTYNLFKLKIYKYMNNLCE